jgi:Tfp pilus assembly protein PilZ
LPTGGGWFVYDDQSIAATVLDMGLGGMRVRVCKDVKIGDKLLVNSPKMGAGNNNQPVPCKVAWIKKADTSYTNYLGLRYDADEKTMARTWAKVVLKELGFKVDSIYSKRKYVRADCMIEGLVTTVDPPKTHQVRVWNLGVKGILFEFSKLLPVGQTVDLQVGPLDKLLAFKATGRLAQVRPEGRIYLYGLEFQDISAQDTQLLGKYLKYLLTKGRTAE